jgi:glycosyltransferase involved in cell wall biosynthesis
MVSLIVPTINRVAELERLLASLDIQTYKDFEVLVVDQNPDERLLPVLNSHPALNIRHLRSERGAARARNVALRVAAGDIVGFPDDDCWYPSTLLANVVQWFQRNPEYDGLFTTMHDANNRPVGPQWPGTPLLVNRTNVWRIGFFVTVFLSRKITDAVGFFREDIGVGSATRYQSGEESDYYLRALARSYRMRYEPSFTVHHPSLHGIDRQRATVYPFALGAGYVMRIHGYSWIGFGAYWARSLGGCLTSLGKGDLPMAQVYWRRAAGQLRGYVLGPKDILRAVDRVDRRPSD